MRIDEGEEKTLPDNTTDNATGSSSEGHDTSSDEGEEPEKVTLTKAELEERDKAIRKDQDKRWKQRLKDKIGEGDDEGEEPVPKEGEVDDRYDRLELKTEGVKDKKEQDVVIDYARFKKITVAEALNTPAVKAELKAMRDKDATPSPSKRTANGRVDEVEYWANQLERNGKSAPTPEMRTKVRAYLAARK